MKILHPKLVSALLAAIGMVPASWVWAAELKRPGCQSEF